MRRRVAVKVLKRTAGLGFGELGPYRRRTVERAARSWRAWRRWLEAALLITGRTG